MIAKLKSGSTLTPTVRVQNGLTGQLLSSGYLSLERLPDASDYVTCTSGSNVATNMVGYTECDASSSRFGSSMNTEEGVFTTPEDGHYEVTFTGLLKSYGGNRVWATLYKIDEGNEGRRLSIKTRLKITFARCNFLVRRQS